MSLNLRSTVLTLGSLSLAGVASLAAQHRTHPAGEVLRKIRADGHPYGVSIDPSDRVYVSQVATDQLVRVDFAPMSEPEVTSIGSQPPHVVVDPDGRSVYATLQAGRAVVRISTASGVTLDSVGLGSDGFNLALDPDDEHLVATAAAGWAYRLTRRPLRIVDSLFVGAAPNGVAFDRSGSRLYVSSRDAGSVVSIDPRTFRLRERWTPGGALQRIAVAPDGHTLFVANEAPGGGITKIDTRTGASTSVPIEGTPYGLGVTPDGQRLWVLLLDRGTIAVLELPSLRVIKVIDVGGRPRNIAFTARGDRAAITTETAIVLLR